MLSEAIKWQDKSFPARSFIRVRLPNGVLSTFGDNPDIEFP